MEGEQRKGILSLTIAGIAGLIILTIVVLVVVASLDGANLLRTTATASTTTNESDDTTTVVWLNQTGYTLANAATENRDYAITSIWASNDTGYPFNLTVPSANYSVSSTGVLRNATTATLTNISVSYTYFVPTDYEAALSNMTGNFTQGVDNVSDKIPTILLIAAVVLLFGVIVLLVKQSQAMGFGDKSGSL